MVLTLEMKLTSASIKWDTQTGAPAAAAKSVPPCLRFYLRLVITRGKIQVCFLYSPTSTRSLVLMKPLYLFKCF